MGYLDRPWLKHYPKDVPPEVEIPDISVTQFIDDAIKRYSKHTAILFYGTTISYEKLGRYIDKMASALHGLGVKKNSVVAIYLPNCPQFIIAYYAALKLGAIPTAVSFLFSPREIKLQLEDSGAECLVMIDLLYEKTKPLITDLGIEKVVLTDILYFMPFFKKKLAVLLKKTPKAKIPKSETVSFFRELLKGNEIGFPTVHVDSTNDVASLVYTSGTTGAPKGVSLTHYNIIATNTQVKATSGDAFKEGNYLLAYLPFFHTYGQEVSMTGGLSMGQTLIVVLRPEFKEILKYIEKYRISLLLGVPAFFRILINHIKSGTYDLSSLKICACGSDYAPQTLKDEWKALTGVDITEGYGLTEGTGTVTPLGAKGKTGSIGLPIPGSLVAIVDPEKDEFVDVGELGEIIISGPQVTTGYWNKGRKNKYPDAFPTIAGKRWIRSGDIGYMDEDGYFYMVERKKDIIKYKAHIIFPGEVEEIIGGYKPVREVTVVGVQADELEFGQAVKAFVVLNDEYKGAIREDDVLNYCKDKLAIYKIPKEIEFLDELPRNAMGKVIRKQLRDG